MKKVLIGIVAIFILSNCALVEHYQQEERYARRQKLEAENEVRRQNAKAEDEAEELARHNQTIYFWSESEVPYRRSLERSKNGRSIILMAANLEGFSRKIVSAFEPSEARTDYMLIILPHNYHESKNDIKSYRFISKQGSKVIEIATKKKEEETLISFYRRSFASLRLAQQGKKRSAYKTSSDPYAEQPPVIVP